MLALVLADSAVVVQVEPELGLCLNWNWLPAAVVLNCADEVVTLLWLNSEVMGAEQVAAGGCKRPGSRPVAPHVVGTASSRTW
jgi:hypothetical protein